MSGAEFMTKSRIDGDFFKKKCCTQVAKKNIWGEKNHFLIHATPLQ